MAVTVEANAIQVGIMELLLVPVYFIDVKQFQQALLAKSQEAE
jgi:hypothetical protein